MNNNSNFFKLNVGGRGGGGGACANLTKHFYFFRINLGGPIGPPLPSCASAPASFYQYKQKLCEYFLTDDRFQKYSRGLHHERTNIMVSSVRA